MATNVEIEKNKNENNLSVIKRFTRRVNESGVLNKVRGNRWLTREPSDFARKQKKLNSLKKKAVVEKMIKLGKMPERRGGRRR